MCEVWLHTNRRAIWFGTLPPALVALLGGWLVIRADASAGHLLRWIGAVFVMGGGGLVAALIAQLRQPRISYDDGCVLFHLRSGPPLAVPAELVEAFFLGQGPTLLAGRRTPDESTMNLVARLSRREPEWHHREVKPALGAWSDGYVTIRGTWCEPLGAQLVRCLNHRLREVSEQHEHKNGARKDAKEQRG